MLEKLLPFLNRSISQNPGEDLPNNLSNINAENLVPLKETPRSIPNRLFLFTFVLMLTFILLVLVNLSLKPILEVQSQEQTRLVNELQNLRSKQDLITSLDKKITFYRNFLQTKKFLAEKAVFIYDHIDPALTVIRGEMSSSEFNVTLTGKNVYLFTQLIMQYLEGSLVSELSITSANFNAGKEEFEVGLTGVFK